MRHLNPASESKRRRKRRRRRKRERRDSQGADLGMRPRQTGRYRCLTCHTPLGLRGGMGGTGLCGPCATGEATTLEEFGETW
jgi:hypothetical protein